MGSFPKNEYVYACPWGFRPSIQIFYNTCDPLSSAHAGGDEAVFFFESFQIVDDLDRQFTTGAAKRMAQGDGAAIDIYDVGIEAQLTDDGQRL